MTREEIISGLQMTMDLVQFDPATGNVRPIYTLNNLDKTTYLACKEAIKALKAQDVPDTNVSNNDDVKIKVINSDKLIKAINEGSYDVNLSAVMALGAVIVDTKRQEICEYCHEDSDGYVKPIEKNGHAFIHFGMNGWCLELRAKGWHGEVKINCCPICGRDLNRKVSVGRESE